MNLEQQNTRHPLISAEEVKATMVRLRALKAEYELKANRSVLLALLIEDCIMHGINAGPRITGAIAPLGFKKRHISMTLLKGTGDDPKAYNWKRDENRRYCSHSAEAQLNS